MPNAVTMTVLAGLAVAGTALGVGLGRSAIEEINPAYLQDKEARFHGDLAANHPENLDQVQSREYAQAPAIASCIGCLAGPPPPFPVEYVPGRDPYVDTSARAWPGRVRAAQVQAAQVVPATAQVVPVQEPQAPDPARERIVRYSSYPVTQEEARTMAERDSAKAGAPAAEGLAATQ
jgi:hypothetical protein